MILFLAINFLLDIIDIKILKSIRES